MNAREYLSQLTPKMVIRRDGSPHAEEICTQITPASLEWRASTGINGVWFDFWEMQWVCQIADETTTEWRGTRNIEEGPFGCYQKTDGFTNEIRSVQPCR